MTATRMMTIIIGLIVAGVLLSAIFRRHVTIQLYDELHVHVEELQRLVRLEPDGAHLDRHLSDPRYDVPNSGYYWEVRFVFLAVPLLVITGDFLTEGGISRKLIAFSRACVGFMNGATASTAMFSCGLFAAISGSNAATAATMGRLLGTEMIERKVKPASPERSSPPPAVRSA